MSNLLLLNDLGMRFPTQNSKQKYRYGLYKCFCGNEFEAIIQNVKINLAKSCGCLKKGPKKIYLNIDKRIYSIWNNMRQRCNNYKNKDYKNYGARGIMVCDEWNINFMSFYKWALDNGYKSDLSIDRINNNLGYSPNNCRWADRSMQNKNRRKWTIKK